MAKQLIIMVSIFAISTGIYSTSLNNSFVYDDEETVTENHFIRSWRNLPGLFSKDYFQNSGELTYRPAVTLTYFIDYAFWKLDPKGYHLTNVLLHSLNAILLYIFVRLLLKRYTGRKSSKTAFMAALLFSVHPVLSETINAISYREDILAATFLISSFILYLKSQPDAYVRKGCFTLSYASSLILYLIALLSKEMAITLPLLLILLDLSILNKSTSKEDFLGKRPIRKGLASNKFRPLSIKYGVKALAFYPEDGQRRFVHASLVTLKFLCVKLINTYIGYFAVTGLYLFIRFSILYNPAEEINYNNYSLLTNFLTMTKVVASYIKLFFYPLVLNADYVVPYSSSLLDITSLLSISLLIAIFAILVKIYRNSLAPCYKNRQNNKGTTDTDTDTDTEFSLQYNSMHIPQEIAVDSRPIFFFAIGWFFVSLLPVLNIVPIINIMAERFLYIPYIGLFITIALLLEDGRAMLRHAPTSFKRPLRLILKSLRFGLETNGIRTKIRLSIFIILILSCSYLTVKRNVIWKDDLSLWSATIKDSPFSAKARYNLGLEYYEENNLDEAIIRYKDAIELNPDYYRAYHNLGMAYERKDNLDEAIKAYKKALHIKPDHAKTHNNLGIAYFRKGDIEGAIKAYKKAIGLDPTFSPAYFNLANAYAELGLVKEAEARYKESIAINPADSRPHNNLGKLYLEEGLIDMAIAELQIGLSYNYDNPVIHFNLGNAYERKGLYEDAIKEYKETIRLDPSDINTHNMLCVAYAEMGRLDDALISVKDALSLDKNDSSSHNNLANIYYMKGLVDKAEEEYKSAIKLDRKNSKAHKNLATLYINEDKERETALFYLKEALHIEADPDEIEQLKDMIEGLQGTNASLSQ